MSKSQNDRSNSVAVSIPNPDNRSFLWAYALYEPTPEDCEATKERFREQGRKASQEVEDRVMKEMLGE